MGWMLAKSAVGCASTKNSKTGYAISVAAIIILTATPATAQNFEILSGGATLQRQGRNYAVGRGVKLYEGDRLYAKPQTIFIGDYGAFVATLKSGFIEFTLLRREGGCIRNLLTYLGKMNLTPRPLTCPRSLLQVLSLASGGSYTFRGTSADLVDEGNRTLLAVNHGAVVVESQGQSVPIGTGQGNITIEGLPPGPAIELDNDLLLQDVRFVRSPLGLKITAKINPLNTVVVKGERFLPKQNVVGIKFPILGNSLSIVVSNPAGKERVYVFPLPTRN